jgi:hypothetical protein
MLWRPIGGLSQSAAGALSKCDLDESAIALDRIVDDPAPLRRRCPPTRSIFDEARTALFSDNARRGFIKSASHGGLHVKILLLESR